MENLTKKMRKNAKCYNKHMTDEYLDKLSVEEVYAFTHPLDRPDFKREYRKIKEAEEAAREEVSCE